MHISQVDTRRISRVVDSIKPNEEIEVKVIKIEEDGRILVSRREAIIEAQGAQKNAATKKGKRF
jgi:S1 RNA binding domain.